MSSDCGYTLFNYARQWNDCTKLLQKLWHIKIACKWTGVHTKLKSSLLFAFPLKYSLSEMSAVAPILEETNRNFCFHNITILWDYIFIFRFQNQKMVNASWSSVFLSMRFQSFPSKYYKQFNNFEVSISTCLLIV